MCRSVAVSARRSVKIWNVSVDLKSVKNVLENGIRAEWRILRRRRESVWQYVVPRGRRGWGGGKQKKVRRGSKRAASLPQLMPSSCSKRNTANGNTTTREIEMMSPRSCRYRSRGYRQHAAAEPARLGVDGLTDGSLARSLADPPLLSPPRCLPGWSCRW